MMLEGTHGGAAALTGTSGLAAFRRLRLAACGLLAVLFLLLFGHRAPQSRHLAHLPWKVLLCTQIRNIPSFTHFITAIAHSVNCKNIKQLQQQQQQQQKHILHSIYKFSFLLSLFPFSTQGYTITA